MLTLTLSPKTINLWHYCVCDNHDWVSMDHATMSLPQTSTSYIKRVQELRHMTMVAWRSHHKHAPQYRSNWHLLSASRLSDVILTDIRWILKTIMIEPAVNDALTKFIKDVCTQQINDYLMIITGLLNGNFYMWNAHNFTRLIYAYTGQRGWRYLEKEQKGLLRKRVWPHLA